jgi:glutaminyl-tRNA synthetase
VIKDPKTGEVTELRCTYDPATKGGDSPDGRKVKATLHWVSAKHAINATVRLYDRLFLKSTPDESSDGKDFRANLNPNSLKVLSNCKLEPSLAQKTPGSRFQFERLGYFIIDSEDSRPDHLVFNRTVTLRDTWAKIDRAQKKMK